MAVDIDARTNIPSVNLELRDGDFLVYNMAVRGSRPIFTLEDSRAEVTILSNDDEPVSEDPLVFSRRWPVQGDKVATVSNHVMGMSFLAAIQYTYVVECHRGDGSVEVLKDMDLTSSSSEDDQFVRLGVNLQL